MKLLIIGTGPAGYAVLSYLVNEKRLNKSSFTIVDVGDKPIRPIIPEELKISEYYDGLYKKMESESIFKFPPSKTHFSHQIPKYLVNSKPSVFHSTVIGGLSNYWGGTMLPFTENELTKWPIKIEDLKKYYCKIANIIGISGRRDDLNIYFTEDYVSRPPIQVPQVLLKLNNVVNKDIEDNNFKVISGVNRCAVETRSDRNNNCLYCGECMCGCVKNSIFSTYDGVEEILRDPRVTFINGKVLTISEKMDVIISNNQKKFKLNGFSKIYLAAGCPNTTEIIMRSTGVNIVNDINDNSVCVFPIIYTGKLCKMKYDRYIALNNLILVAIPRNNGLKYAQVLVYPNFDYLWRYNAPECIWPLFKKIVRYSRERVFWGRLYIHGDYSQSYKISMINDTMHLTNERHVNKSIFYITMNSIRKAVNRSGFFIPKIRPVIQKTNSHYSSTVPYGLNIFNLKNNGEIFPDVYLCDSTVFPNLPAVPLTFTIMANAYRTAVESIGD